MLQCSHFISGLIVTSVHNLLRCHLLQWYSHPVFFPGVFSLAAIILEIFNELKFCMFTSIPLISHQIGKLV